MCERKEKRGRLSIIQGGVKEVFYCPREISFLFFFFFFFLFKLYFLEDFFSLSPKHFIQFLFFVYCVFKQHPVLASCSGPLPLKIMIASFYFWTFPSHWCFLFCCGCWLVGWYFLVFVMYAVFLSNHWTFCSYVRLGTKKLIGSSEHMTGTIGDLHGGWHAEPFACRTFKSASLDLSSWPLHS